VRREKLQKELAHYLTRPLGLEAVLRVRSTKGLNMHTFHGNFFIRAQDLLALPNVSPDNGYTFQISLDNDLEGALCFFQAALLYTTSAGERRIRVHTLALPVTKDPTAVYAHADPMALSSLLAKMAVDRMLSAKVRGGLVSSTMQCVSPVSTPRVFNPRNPIGD